MASRQGPVPPLTPESMSASNRKGPENNGMRQRASNTSRRQYNNPIGGSGYADELTLAISPSRASDPHRRRQIRSRLRQKHQAKVPLKALVAWTKFMDSDTKNHIVAMIGEFIGTTMFLFFAFAGTQVANIGAGQTAGNSTTGAATGFNPAVLLYISFCFGFSLMVNAWVFFRISGGLFNPAVTLALTILGDLDVIRAVLLFITQVSGACFAAYLVSVIFPTPFNVQTTLATGTSLAQGIWIEALCTAELVFTIIMLAKEKHRATFVAPIGIGLALFIAELVSVYYTGGSLNPARSFGPAAVTHRFHDDQWIYWLGPFIGTILAVLFYWLFKGLEYEMVNPGQDGDVDNDPTQNPEHEIAQTVEEREEEVQEIQAIEEHPGGLDSLIDGELSVEGSVLNQDGVSGMAVRGAKEDDEVHVQRKRSKGPDLEAQWHPDGCGMSDVENAENIYPKADADGYASNGGIAQVENGHPIAYQYTTNREIG